MLVPSIYALDQFFASLEQITLPRPWHPKYPRLSMYLNEDSPVAHPEPDHTSNIETPGATPQPTRNEREE